MFRWIVFVLLLLVVANLFSQVNKDSINQLVSISSDSASSEIYFNLLKETNPDSINLLIEYSQKAEFHAKLFLEDNKYPGFLNRLGNIFYNKSNFTLAEKYFLKASEIEKVNGNEVAYAKMLSNVAVISELRGDYEKAIGKYIEAMAVFEKSGNKQGLAFVYNNIGVVFEEMNRKEDALQYHKQALKIKTLLNDSLGMASSLNNLGVVFQELYNNYDSAIFYYQISLDIYSKLKSADKYAITLQNIAKVKELSGNRNEAHLLYNQALITFSQNANNQGIAWSHRNIGHLFLQKQLYDSALFHLQKSLDISLKINDKKTVLDVINLLSDTYYNKQNFKLSADYLKKYTILSDSLINSQKQMQIDELKIKYETSQMQYNIDNLKYENQLKTEHLRQVWFLVIGLIISTLLIIVSFILFRERTRFKNQKIQAELQYKLLSLQMNPHFISNALASIQNFIYQNNTTTAADYLSNFTRLMRQTIKNTREEVISLDEEIQYLKDYASIQQLRLNQSFDFEINVSPDIDPEATQVYPMFVQPYVENAIKHGFKNINYKGVLKVNFSRRDKLLLIEIEDNGKGMTDKIAGESEQVGYSLNITNERIKNMKTSKKEDASVNIVNINQPGKTGLRVELALPFFEL